MLNSTPFKHYLSQVVIQEMAAPPLYFSGNKDWEKIRKMVSDGSVTITGNEIAKRLGMKSTALKKIIRTSIATNAPPNAPKYIKQGERSDKLEQAVLFYFLSNKNVVPNMIANAISVSAKTEDEFKKLVDAFTKKFVMRAIPQMSKDPGELTERITRDSVPKRSIAGLVKRFMFAKDEFKRKNAQKLRITGRHVASPKEVENMTDEQKAADSFSVFRKQLEALNKSFGEPKNRAVADFIDFVGNFGFKVTEAKLKTVGEKDLQSLADVFVGFINGAISSSVAKEIVRKAVR